MAVVYIQANVLHGNAVAALVPVNRNASMPVTVALEIRVMETGVFPHWVMPDSVMEAFRQGGA